MYVYQIMHIQLYIYIYIYYYAFQSFTVLAISSDLEV